MNTYPFIGKFQSAVKIFFNHGNSAVIESGHGVARHESNFKNITAEYLANTYGEVKSKEHAEFIVKLCKANDIPVVCSYKTSHIKSFHASCGCVGLYPYAIDELIVNNMKKITIPLPPECESADEWPKVGDEVYLKCGSGIIKLPKDNEGFYIVEVNGGYTACKAYEMKKDKPKTEDEILAEELIAKYRHLSKTQQVHAIATDIINNAISRYKVTKKPQ